MNNFKVGMFKPTDRFVHMAESAERHGMSPCAVAAGFLAYFTDGDDMSLFVDCLIEDGITREGLIDLAQACLEALKNEEYGS
jgi:hypothetical protein